jgi:3',5'-cyclic AMP phosphodiesterase CpdA
MGSQLRSTRIFNENYFAFLTALDDIVAKGVKIVVMPGDFSDDGQPVHVRGLQKILQEYEKRYGLQFYLITGNHDPVKPFKQDAFKDDFLGEGGKRQPISSNGHLYVPSDPKTENPVVVSEDIVNMGYEGITAMLPDFGFFPHKKHLYWETPFSDYTVGDYTYKKAREQSDLKNRNYPIGEKGFLIPDVSYLVEPIKGLWLLALDANVYLPRENMGGDSENPKNYQGASIGYNNVLGQKKHLIQWVEKVMVRAKVLNKTVIAFSHYPMIDFNDDSTDLLKQLMGDNKMQLQRVPKEEVARTFANAGLKIHFGGHMHMNDTGIRKTQEGNTLVNVQVPSLAAYLPAYKLLTFKEGGLLEIQTITIDSVPDIRQLFGLYAREHDFLGKTPGAGPIWDRNILKVKSYREFTSFHLRELVRLRFVPEDWPQGLSNFLMGISGDDLLTLSRVPQEIDLTDILKLKHTDPEMTKVWGNAVKEAKEQEIQNGLQWKDMEKWTGLDLITDFYRIHNADLLALKDIPAERLEAYRLITHNFAYSPHNLATVDTLRQGMNQFSLVFLASLQGAPADHFIIDLTNGTLTDMDQKQ